jgi:hypothetical protein
LYPMKAPLPALVLGAALAASLAGCGRPRAATGTAEAGLHRSVPPHGGTPVALGEDYRLELVRDAEAGTFSAYVLDDDMEEFIRVPAPSLTLLVRIQGEDRPLVLAPVANPATGETVGSTSLFQGQADWIRATPSFQGKVRSLTIRGTTFTDVPFSFPAAAE